MSKKMPRKLKYETVDVPRGTPWPDSMCFSCALENCPGSSEVTKFKAVVKCNSWAEQVFKISEADKKRIRELVAWFCDKNVLGQHNITQSNDGWDYMMDELYFGIKYALTHRKAFNYLREIGEEVMTNMRKP